VETTVPVQTRNATITTVPASARECPVECPVCSADTRPIGSVHSDFSDRDFALRSCDGCGFAFVADPRTDFAQLYDAAYYEGKGADSFIDYVEEMGNPRTVREYEWRGIARLVGAVAPMPDAKWLDYGCGLGGLVRYARAHGFARAYGFDEGWSADWAASHGIPVLDRGSLAEHEGTFDVVTAIEVIEHVTAPVDLMQHVATLLKPGGTFMVTTGNAEPHRADLPGWSYVHPDVHVSYFEPRTLAEVYRRAGLEPFYPGFAPGHSDVIRYKVLKTLRVKSRGLPERAVPWALASRAVDRRHRVTAQPFARRPLPTPAP
jgi:SAM-dependent methyltransferase